ncbi:MAG: substrate-binding domain-containing protein [Candidatus Rokubacteria bacterium]|nr:substrate-binding domain-containing protein [Candidatus Rokubacteria bacterium]
MRRLVGSVLLLALGAGGAIAQARVVILSTTTSTQDSGLLDVLVPIFEKKTGLSVKTIAVGTGQALALAARGEADVTLAHARDLERKHVAEGKLLNRRLVMYSDFVLVGPADDPARIRGLRMAVDAFRRIAERQARFVSRGDRSGTHVLELALWRAAGVEPRGAWYVESGQGMGATLTIANERRAYALTDRATLLALQRRLELPVLVEGDRALLNVYAVLEVNPGNGPRVNAAGGRAFAEFLVSPEAQAVIRTFGVERYGRPLFVPLGGKMDAEVGG